MNEDHECRFDKGIAMEWAFVIAFIGVVWFVIGFVVGIML